MQDMTRDMVETGDVLETGDVGVADIEYAVVQTVDPGELYAFYQRQHHETAASEEALARMLDRASCFVTARDDGRLIGVARGVSDGLNGYLAECKLDPAYQGPAAVTRIDGRIEHDDRAIAREMATRVLESLRAYGVERIFALAYGTEVDFCEALGFKKSGGLVPMQLDANVPSNVGAD